MKNAVINVRCDIAFKERLNAFASARNTSVSAIVISLINKAIDDLAYQQAFERTLKTLDIDLNDYSD